MEVTKKLKLKHLISKVVKGLQFLEIYRRRDNYVRIRDIVETREEDVREGYFVVIAMQGEETKRFVIELEYLRDPCFIKLLEHAKEEFGYQQNGVIVLPCNPQELQNILENRLIR